MMTSLNKRNRRGQVFLEIILIAIGLLFVGLIWFFTDKPFTDINHQISVSPGWSNQSQQIALKNSNTFNGIGEFAVLFFFGLSWLFLLISGYYLDSNALFFIIVLILTVFSYIGIVVIGNIYSQVASDPAMATTALRYPYTIWLFNHLLEVIIVEVSTVFMVIFGKKNSQGGL